jgi:hypothetical protein
MPNRIVEDKPNTDRDERSDDPSLPDPRPRETCHIQQDQRSSEKAQLMIHREQDKRQ